MEPNKRNKTIINIIVIVLILADIFFAVWFSQRNIAVSLALIGVLLLGLLISTTVHSVKKVKHFGYRAGALFIPIGVILFIGAIAVLVIKFNVDFDKAFILCIESMPMYVGIAVIINRVAYKLTKNKYCTFPANALCTGISKKHVGDRHGRVAATAGIFKLQFDGEEYTVREDTHSFTNQPEKGHEYTVYISPDDPEDIYFPNKMGDVTNYIMGAAFIAYDIVFFAVTAAINS